MCCAFRKCCTSPPRHPSLSSSCVLLLTFVSQAFTKLGFGFEEKCWCYETCAAVLHLGNISFSPNGEGSQVGEGEGDGEREGCARWACIT